MEPVPPTPFGVRRSSQPDASSPIGHAPWPTTLQEAVLDIFDASRDIVLMFDPNGYLLWHNGRLNGIGRDGRDANGRVHLAKLMPKGEFERLWHQALPRALDSTATSFETWIVPQDGPKLPVELQLIAHRDDEGRLRRFSATCRDLTAQRRFEKAIDRERIVHERLLRGAPLMIITYHLASGRILFCNRLWREVFGWEPDSPELAAGALSVILHPDDRPVAEKALAALQSGSASIPPLKLRERTKWGEWRTLVNHLAIIEADESGSPTVLLAMSEDITDRLRAEMRQRERDALLQSIYEQAEVGIFTVDRDEQDNFRLSSANPRWLKLIAMSAERVEDRSIEDVFSEFPGFSPLIHRELTEAIKHQATRAFETELSVGGQHVWWRVTLTPVLQGNGRTERVIGLTYDTTARRSAENLLKDREQFLDSIYTGIDLAIITADVFEDGSIRYTGFNPAAERLTRRHPTEDTSASKPPWSTDVTKGFKDRIGNMLGKTPAEAFPDNPDLAAEYERRLRRSVEEGIVHEYEEHHVFDGLDHYWTTRMLPLTNDRGHVWRIVITNAPTTDRKFAERQLLERQQFLDSIYNGMAVAVSVFDVDGEGECVYRGINKIASELTGLDADWIVGRRLEDLPVSREEIDLMKSLFREAILSGTTFEYEIEMPFRGQQMWWSCLLTPTTSHTGAVTRLVCSAIPITDRKRAERQVRASMENYQSLVESAPSGIIVCDQSGIILETNPTARKLAGREAAGELVGHPLQSLLAPEDEQRFGKLLSQTTLQSSSGGEFSILLPSGGRTPLEIRLGALPDERRVAFLSDISERRRNEESRRTLEAQLVQAQKVESMGVLAGGIAHDFNNLLTGIIGFVELALAETPEDSSVRESLLMIETSAHRATELTRQLLAYTGRGHVKFEAIDLVKLVEAMVPLTRTALSRRAALHFETVPGLPRVEADPTQLRQIVMNLLMNANDALQDQAGDVTLRVGQLWASRSYLTDPWIAPDLPEGNYCYIEVRDSGCGMSEQVRSRMFDPFFTTKQTGHGLGLAAVLGIVRSHNGFIKVESIQGEGTTIRIGLPALTSDATPPHPTPIPAEAPAKRKSQGLILVVDDEVTLRNLLERVLGQLGYETIVAGDGAEAIKKVEAEGPRLTAIFLDLIMPKVPGNEAFRAIRRLRPDLPIVLTTGYDAAEALGGLLNEPRVGFLQKPFQIGAIRLQLLQLLRADGPNSPR